MATDFHPDLRRIARFAPRTLVSPRTLRLIRTLMRLQGLRGADDVNVEELVLDSGVGIRLHRRPGVTDVAPALLWIHGGGYVLGGTKQDERLCLRFNSELGITVASVDYRLAPEHPYPAALDDCYSALTWLSRLPAVDPARVAIGGASAGGGLAAAVALLARDRGEITPVLLAYPMLDDRSGSGPKHRDYRLWSSNSNRFGWASYLGAADPQVAVPARHDDLSGLAPAWIGVGTHDLLHDEDLVYAERLNRAGVPCHVEVVPGAFHGFDLVAPKAQVSRSFSASQCAGLRTAFGTHPKRAATTD